MSTHDIAVWSQIVLYTGTGAMKLVKSPRSLTDDLGYRWASTFPAWTVKAIAGAELAAAATLATARLSGRGAGLARWAARGLGLLQVGAVAVNVRHDETARVPINVVALVLAVAADRTTPTPAGGLPHANGSCA